MRSLLNSFLIILVFVSCSTTRNTVSKKDNGRISINFVQINDVYEITPLSGGKEGGMARVATLKKNYLRKNPNTFLVMAGDFVSPSVYNSMQYQGKAIRGKQMIETMNIAGVDFAIFGNHEFDIKESELQDRIDESGFQWISSNAFHRLKDKVVPFSKTNGIPFPKTFILNLKDKDGTSAKIGFIGLCLPFNQADYVSYTDALSTAKELFKGLKDSVDAVIAITHQLMKDDEQLATEIPGLSLILGGHEHDQRFKKVGNIYITKALANARSAFVVRLRINKKKNRIKVDPKLELVNESIKMDSTTNAVVQKWTEIAEKNYSSLGFEAKKVIIDKGEPLDGRETEIRTHPTNLTKLIISAMANAVPAADVVLLNSGSIRVDDILPLPVTEYDILRSLPFGGGIHEVDMKGSLLIQTLNQGKKNQGIGGFLLYNEEVTNDPQGNWFLKGSIIDPAKIYRVAISEFLFTGKEAHLEFLNPGNPGISKVYDTENSITGPRSDIRLAIVKYLEKK